MLRSPALVNAKTPDVSVGTEDAFYPCGRRAAHRVLGLLLVVNLINYVDRQILYALLPSIQNDLALSDAQAGSLASAFMVVYMLAAAPIGYIADRWGRPFWISLGIGLWSLATAASGLARGFAQLFAARAAVGIGESCYGAISPSFVAEHFPPRQRGRVMAVFSMAIPVGSALGYVAGGALGQAWGWRNAFYMVGLPGLALMLLSLRLREPARPASDTAKTDNLSAWASYLGLFRIPSYLYVTLAGAAMTFSLGGFAVWMPSFFHRQWGLSIGQAGTLFGAITVVSGVLGSLAGGWLSDWALRWTSRSYFLVSGVGYVIGLPLAVAALLAPSLTLASAAIFLSELFLFLNMGPINAVIVAVTPPGSRSMAFAANILVIHALGDAVSPALIGAASDRWGLTTALMGASLALALAAAFCFLGLRRYDEDAGKAGHA
ncbi:MAG TPA: MFS transporter [Elusimicrobia bacterium]|nr:MFS transporter [Elusimicrobiota bacterium]HBT62282.1 MFS transporter [Elusimicrobiota bacterium]